MGCVCACHRIRCRLRKSLAFMQWRCSTANTTNANDHRVYASPDQCLGSRNGVFSFCLVLAQDLERRLGALLVACGRIARGSNCREVKDWNKNDPVQNNSPRNVMTHFSLDLQESRWHLSGSTTPRRSAKECDLRGGATIRPLPCDPFEPT